MRRLSALLAATALGLAVPATANSVTNDFDRSERNLRTLLFNDPAGALKEARELQSAARQVRDASTRELQTVTLNQIEGEALRRLNQHDQALPLLQQALRRVPDSSAGRAIRGALLLSLSAIYSDQARVADALSMSQQAYKTFSELGQKRGQVKALSYLAFIYDDANDFEAVVKYLRQAQEIGGTDPDLLISVDNNLAGALKELGRYREAKAAYDLALAAAQRTGATLPHGSILGGLARNALLSGDVPAAQRYVTAGLDLARDPSAAALRPTLLSVQAQVYVRLGRPKAAIRVLEEVFAGEGPNGTSLKSREAHETAWQAYRDAGQPALALDHLETLKRLDDEATKLATSTSTALMAARFDFANQNLRIANLKAEQLRRSVAAEREQARFERLFFAAAAAATMVVMTLLAVGLFTIRRSRNAVRAANLTLEDTNNELARALAARTEFLATTSHEIRTPLNGILGMTQVMLADETLADPLRDRIGVVHAAGNTMRSLVDDILDVAKIESARLVLEVAPFDLGSVVAEAARLWEGPIRAKGIDFACRSDVARCMVLGDAARVRQVVFNLLSNATKFTEAGRITLSVRWVDGDAEIAVQDTGIGIPADKLEDVFESFRQADAGTARRFGGTGLGLAICRQLARAMGGDVEVVSEAGRGSTFTFTAPLKTAVDAVEGTPATSGDAPRFLVVDRNPISRAMLRTLLEQAGLHVAVAANGEAMIAMMNEGPVSGVLVDAATLGPLSDAVAAATQAADLAGMPVTLLLPADAPEVAADDRIRLVRRPIPGPELVRQLVSRGSGINPTLVSRAA